MIARDGSSAIRHHRARTARGVLLWALLSLVASLTLATVHAYDVEVHAEHPVCLSCVACTGLDAGTLPALPCLGLAHVQPALPALSDGIAPAGHGSVLPGARAPPLSSH